MHYDLFKIDEGFCMVTMENGEEQRRKLMTMMLNAGVKIQKYYWRSKLSEDYISVKDPVIIDAFNFHVDFIGDIDKIKYVLREYEKIEHIYKHLDRCLFPTISEEQIGKEALRLLNNL